MEEIISCCGVICSKCQYYPESCKGCPTVKGQVFWLEYIGEKICQVYSCCINDKKLSHCGHCPVLPCNLYKHGDPTKTTEENETDLKNQLAQLKLMN